MSREPARQEDPSLGLLRHVQALVRTCGGPMPEHDAEDLAQEALLALVAYEEQWGPIANARTGWFLSCAISTSSACGDSVKLPEA